MPENRSTEIRSEEVQEILSHVPHWLIRSGITTIFSTVLLILIASWFIKYPDIVMARVTITTPIPPVNIVAKSSGAIELMTKEDEEVRKGEILGVIENSATSDDVFRLIDLCTRFSKNESNLALFISEEFNLGDVQQSYLQFARSLADLRLFEELRYYDEQIEMLQLRISQYTTLYNALKNQLATQRRSVSLAQENYARDSLLFKNQVVTKFDKNDAESTLLQVQANYQLSESNLINNQIQVNQLHSQIADLESKKSEQQRNLQENVRQTFEQLESDLEVWKQQFLLTSPVEGKVSLSTFWTDNQYVNVDDEVMTIIPEETIAFGRMELPVLGSGKVEEGQRVNIKLDNYPYQEYGMVQGKIQTKSLVPSHNNYILTLSLPRGLKSSYNKDLTFNREMQGTAEIITKDLRIIERVFNQFRSLLDNSG